MSETRIKVIPMASVILRSNDFAVNLWSNVGQFAVDLRSICGFAVNLRFCLYIVNVLISSQKMAEQWVLLDYT